MEEIAENLEIIHRKKQNRLKDGVQGNNLVVFFTELLAAWLSADSDLVVTIEATWDRLGIVKPFQKFPRDILVKFPQ